mmetsp:Transcript_33262/g.80764  ORF Transcript_33262/g.80764 Transcript_33262/m.80764 type:complete len:117 (-) Transcript_33262:34-384(-)
MNRRYAADSMRYSRPSIETPELCTYAAKTATRTAKKARHHAEQDKAVRQQPREEEEEGEEKDEDEGGRGSPALILYAIVLHQDPPVARGPPFPAPGAPPPHRALRSASLGGSDGLI